MGVVIARCQVQEEKKCGEKKEESNVTPLIKEARYVCVIMLCGICVHDQPVISFFWLDSEDSLIHSNAGDTSCPFFGRLFLCTPMTA